MDMRLRLPELLEEHDMSAYRLAKESGGRISLSTAYRLMRSRGQVQYLETKALDAICDVLGIGPEQLLTRDDAPAAKRKGKR